MIQCVDTPEGLTDSWFVIWAESRAEKKVEQRMAAMGLSPELPIVKERHRWSERFQEVECPLFSGYKFAKAINADWHGILRTPGVLTMVKESGKPALRANSFLTTLRDAIGRKGPAPTPVTDRVEYAPGYEVIVQEGALCGVRGVVRERRGVRQLVIWVAEIGRGVALTLGTPMVKAADTREAIYTSRAEMRS